MFTAELLVALPQRQYGICCVFGILITYLNNKVNKALVSLWVYIECSL